MSSTRDQAAGSFFLLMQKRISTRAENDTQHHLNPVECADVPQHALKTAWHATCHFISGKQEHFRVTHVPTIIVIDDQTGMQSLLCQILLDAGYSVRGTAQRSLALKVLDEGHPAIVIMDWRHDGLSGMTARQFIDIVHKKYSEVEFIIMTTHEGAAQSASDIGIRHVLRKPFQVDDLLSVVGNCAAGVAKAS
jgi:CheY-like chemotaxis protein